MKVMIAGVGSPGNAITFALPAKVMSLAGMPRSFDSAEKPFETFIVGDEFDTSMAAESGYERVALAFIDKFLERLPPNIAAVEWRTGPDYEVTRNENNKWRGHVRCRYTTHTEIPA